MKDFGRGHGGQSGPVSNILFKQCGIMIAKIMLSVFCMVRCRLKSFTKTIGQPRVKRRENKKPAE